MPGFSSNRTLLLAGLLLLAALVLFLWQRGADDEAPPTRPEAGRGGAQAVSTPGSRGSSRGPGRRAPLPADPVAGSAARQEVERFVARYRGLTEPSERISLLMDARMLEVEDHSTVYHLLLDEAVGPDAEVREVARTALREYGGARAAGAVRLLLESDSQLPERSELEELANFLELPRRDGAP